jgi:putative oxidoreductase
MNKITDPIARILLSALFLLSGFNKIMHFGVSSQMIAGMGVPFASLATGVAILIEIGGAIAIIAGWKTKLVAWVQFAYLIPVTFMIHDFWASPSAMQQDQLAHFMKNLAIMGGLLILAGRGPGDSAIDESR